ncbi:MAG: hypothetical protein IPK26_03205 [Planctomycetes bacterium]|nr:hypothetical protein [Planctomycetota bacterium]
MHRQSHVRHRRRAGLAAVLMALVACERQPAADPHNREIPWAYGPTANLATEVHLRGTGKEGGVAMANGWTCRVEDGKRLIVTARQIAPSHPLLGQVVLGVKLFDKSGQDIKSFESPPIRKDSATFHFELTPEVAARLWDVILWYRKP